MMLDCDVTRRGFLAGVGATAALAAIAGTTTRAVAAGSATVESSDPSALAPAELLEPGLTYLNNATLGCSPAAVIDATVAAMRELERNPAYEMYEPFIERMEEARTKAAKFLGCDP